MLARFAPDPCQRDAGTDDNPAINSSLPEAVAQRAADHITDKGRRLVDQEHQTDVRHTDPEFLCQVKRHEGKDQPAADAIDEHGED